MQTEVMFFIGGAGISVITYFLKNTMNDLKRVKDLTYKNSTKIELLEKEYMLKIERLNEKISLLYVAIDKLTEKIESLNERI
jgi:hypothetical protein